MNAELVGATTQLSQYQDWLARRGGQRFGDYQALWHWSVTDLEGFWGSLWDYFAVESPGKCQRVLGDPVMPGARWFEGAKVNYARQVLRHAGSAHQAGRPAIVSGGEGRELGELSWPELSARVAALATRLEAMGVEPGDRVAAYLPNIPETVIAFLATVSVGAVWSVCSPEMGPVSVLDRLRQIAPKVLLSCQGYRYGGKEHDRSEVVRTLVAELPTLTDLVLVPGAPGMAIDLESVGSGPRVTTFEQASSGQPAPGWEPRWVPFDHPLWIVYSSGTTGMPKPIVHGHGGVILEALKLGVLQNDIGPEDRFHWYTTTGWIMWNCQVGGLLGGTTICIYDGNPGWPDWTTLWRFVGAAQVSFFGAGSAYYAACLKAGVEPNEVADLARLGALGATGSPLSIECYEWGYRHVRPDIWWCVISGGTDFAGAFIGGNRMLPVVPGQMQCRCLGAAVAAWSDDGRELIGEVGELVCTRPMPSMPLYLWGDADGERYRQSYFEMFPGVWRHGDWIRITAEGGAIIYGRSDTTINRLGIRMGTAEIYRAVEALPEVLDSLVVDLEYLGRESYMPLFVVLRPGAALDAPSPCSDPDEAVPDLASRIKGVIRTALSARHVPDEIIAVPEIPRTLSGKKLELPIRRLLLGEPPAKVLNRDAMGNPASLEWYIDFARRRAERQ